jgi:hypothetical protein
MDARELPDDDFPLVLNTGRLQHQWHTMTKTGKVDKLNKLDNGPSSPLVSPHEVQLTVSVVRYRGADGRQRGGVCSTFLADRAAAAPVFLQRSPHFRPPEDGGTPMIMVGPGSRRTQLAVLRRPAPRRKLLLPRRFGGHDLRRPPQPVDLAFSRDQADRVYVQHKMLDYGADVWRWLDDGAHFYVCGDAARMAKDVDAALTAIIRRHGLLSEEHAHDYKRELVAAKRYVRDVY